MSDYRLEFNVDALGAPIGGWRIMRGDWTLATFHYNYGFTDNATVRRHAELALAAIAPSPMSDDVVERVARALAAFHLDVLHPDDAAEWCEKAERGLSALRPGDELPGGLAVVSKGAWRPATRCLECEMREKRKNRYRATTPD